MKGVQGFDPQTLAQVLPVVGLSELKLGGDDLPWEDFTLLGT